MPATSNKILGYGLETGTAAELKPGFQLNATHATHATQPIAFSWKPKSAQETQ